VANIGLERSRLCARLSQLAESAMGISQAGTGAGTGLGPGKEARGQLSSGAGATVAGGGDGGGGGSGNGGGGRMVKFEGGGRDVVGVVGMGVGGLAGESGSLEALDQIMEGMDAVTRELDLNVGKYNVVVTTNVSGGVWMGGCWGNGFGGLLV
jgi:fibronectin-binding autotransporter adhesin